MNGLPSREQIDNESGIYSTEKKCPKCKTRLKYFDGGSQGGVAFYFCSNSDCAYEKR